MCKLECSLRFIFKKNVLIDCTNKTFETVV